MTKKPAIISKITIYVDESGTLPDSKDRTIILAAAGTDTPEEIERLFKTMLKTGALKRPGGELKFYSAGEKTKDKFFHALTKKNILFFILIVNKQGKQIIDSPENFATLSWLLIENVLNFYHEVFEVVFDRHFSSDREISEFNKIFSELLEQKITIRHVDSKFEKAVNIADMVAGATLAKETGKNTNFYQIIEPQIISTIQLNWPEAKRKFFDKKRLAQTGASAHPSKLRN